MNSILVGDAETSDLIKNDQRQSTVIFTMQRDFDLNPFIKSDGVKAFTIESKDYGKAYKFVMPVTPTCPMGTTLTVWTHREPCSIIQIVTSDFSSRHGLIKFLHDMFNVDPEDLEINWICSKGSLGNVRQVLHDIMFDCLLGPKDDFDRNLN